MLGAEALTLAVLRRKTRVGLPQIVDRRDVTIEHRLYAVADEAGLLTEPAWLIFVRVSRSRLRILSKLISGRTPLGVRPEK